MNCKTCNYPLWNMKQRRCPECGAEFRISDFKFVPNSVQFRCPHCEQSYYGTDAANGHIIPRQFTCVRCGQAIGIEEMVLVPTEGVPEKKTVGDKHPWLDREGSFFMAWARTVFRSCFQPLRLVDATRPQASVMQSWHFLVSTLVLTALGGGGLLVLLIFVMNWGARPPSFDAVYRMGLNVAVGFGAALAATGLWILVTHETLRLTGPTKGLRRTTHAMCFACGPLILGAAPCLGFYTFWAGVLWWMVNTAVFLVKMHHVHSFRAVLAAISFPGLLLIALLLFLYYRGII